ncbi:MAG TPA: alpha/beta fold hydrolase [Azospirillum sp.]|nr:alpha/beta fold hydrolase [Azospirillum sp.]
MDAVASDVTRIAGLAAHVQGHGPTMLLFHGGMGSWTHWTRNVDALACRFRIVAVDLPGFGDSPDVPEGTGVDAYLDRVAEAASAAGPGRLHLVGFSFGGATAASVAVRLKDRLAALTLVGPGGFGEPKGRHIRLEKMPPPDAPWPELCRVLRHNLGQWMLSTSDAADEDTAALHWANIRRARFDSRRVSLRASIDPDLRRLTAPVQVIWGERDVLAYPSIAARAAVVRGARPDARIAIVPGAGHWAQFERAEAVNRLLLDFHTQATEAGNHGV